MNRKIWYRYWTGRFQEYNYHVGEGTLLQFLMQRGSLQWITENDNGEVITLNYIENSPMFQDKITKEEYAKKYNINLS